MLKCIAIDDDPLALQLIKGHIGKVPSLELLNVFDDLGEAIPFIGTTPIELLFADLNVTDPNNLRKFRSLDDKPMIIVTTASRKGAPEGFEADVIDHLLKPVSLEHFRKAVAKSEEYYKFKRSLEAKEEYLYVYSAYKNIKIRLDDIEFIESLDDYVRIHLTDGKPVLTLMPFKQMIQKLPADKFKRVHRSYVVAVSKIHSFTNRKVVLENAEVPVSDSYLEEIRKLRSS